MARIIGIDLGTTTTLGAYIGPKGPEILPNRYGDRYTPSVVAFTKSGEVLVGKKAKHGAVMNIGRTVFSIKRHMGTSYRVRVDGHEYTPQEISAIILQSIKQDAEDFFGEPVDQAVVTVPAYFTEVQRQATKDAGEIAGFKVRRVIDEPTAAAISYGLNEKGDQKIMVYDLGGGTFDVSIIEISSGVFHVLGINGNAHLGGDDFDKKIVDWILDKVKEEHDIDLSEDPIALQRIKEAAEDAKIDLSNVTEAHILLEAVTITDKGPLSVDFNISRQEFEDMIKDMVESTQKPMEQALADAKMKKEDIDSVLLVGGSTRIPLVQRVVKKFTGKPPQKDIIPDEVVAQGAAVQTLAMKGIETMLDNTLAEKYMKDKPVIVHVTPFSLGVGLKDDQFAPLIEKNSTYPSEEKDVFTTTRDFQEAISFPIFEGESELASENTFLDLLRIEGITPAPKGVPRIEVSFVLNQDRILEVRAEDLATGAEKRIVVEATGEKLSEEEKIQMVKKAKERALKMVKQRLVDAAREEGGMAIERAENALPELEAEQKEKIEKATADLKDILKGQDNKAILEKTELLNQMLNEWGF